MFQVHSKATENIFGLLLALIKQNFQHTPVRNYFTQSCVCHLLRNAVTSTSGAAGEESVIGILLGTDNAHVMAYQSQLRVILTLRRLMSYIYIYIYIYGAPILDVSRSHTTTQHSR